MSSLHKILYIVGELGDIYYLVYEKWILLLKSGRINRNDTKKNKKNTCSLSAIVLSFKHTQKEAERKFKTIHSLNR